MLESVIGGLDPKLDQMKESKFIIVGKPTALEFYALQYIDNERVEIFHRDVAHHFNQFGEDILGGGYYEVIDDTLYLRSHSVGFGPVPNEIAATFAKKIAEHFRTEGKDIKSVIAEMTPLSIIKDQFDDYEVQLFKKKWRKYDINFKEEK
tara:strand:- start:27 stop:476 length:450 start_codon:yes stop_codon:yes gene_type:complete